jgi:hypothetical protein
MVVMPTHPFGNLSITRSFDDKLRQPQLLMAS